MDENLKQPEQVRKRYGSPTFYRLLDEMAKVHDAKSHDYAPDDNPYANYEFAGSVALMFPNSPLDAGLAGRLAEKIYRLSVLGKRRAAPQNESVADTERDIAVIATLWAASRKDRATELESNQATDTEYKSAPNKVLSPHEAASCDGFVEIIRIENFLLDKDLDQAIKYLGECAAARQRAKVSAVSPGNPVSEGRTKLR